MFVAEISKAMKLPPQEIEKWHGDIIVTLSVAISRVEVSVKSRSRLIILVAAPFVAANERAPSNVKHSSLVSAWHATSSPSAVTLTSSAPAI